MRRYRQRPPQCTLRCAGGPSAPCVLLLLLIAIVSGIFQQAQAVPTPAVLPVRLQVQPSQSPAPFLSLPYYGNAKLQTRINSYFDHDKPWYAADNIFVRYDGKRWRGSDTSVLNCDPGTTCYDGHNGYDLGLRFEPVLSAAAGTVTHAGWYNAMNHSDSFGLWVSIDHGNGFSTVYGHLSALTVAMGAHVGERWQIGVSGTTGSSTGPHLHFGTYYTSSWQATDPSGWQGQYADPNIVPDHYLWTGGTGTTPVPLLSSQKKDLVAGAVLVDDGSPGWAHTGQWKRARAASDIGGSLHWTSTTGRTTTASATWQTALLSDGYYEVGVFVDDNHASSGWALYTVYSSDPAHPDLVVKHHIEVDQEHVGMFQNAFGSVNTGAQWIGLGTYYFSAPHPGRVVLTNATGESGQQLAADGVEFAPLAPPSYGFTFSSDRTPAQMTAGSSVTVGLTLHNSSNFPWQAHSQNAVRLIYRWLDSQNHIASTSAPISLVQDLKAGTDEPLQVSVQAPARPGTYTLQWDLVLGRRTFSKLGGQPETDPVTVQAGSGQHL
jgi:murein DD-endopeptidase MepM/ murein hydrolase activator NlpD